MISSLCQLNFEKLCILLNIGNIADEPIEIRGGFLHRMFKIQTDKGTYAIKVLNPNIMEKNDAIKNFLFSEIISSLVKQKGINVISALTIDDNPLFEIEGKYYLVYEWFEGTTLAPIDADSDKCYIIGSMLAKIHNIDFNIPDTNAEEAPININWKYYYDKGTRYNMPWANIIGDNIENLTTLQNETNNALVKLNEYKIISHRDLDQKNVMWDRNMNPIIIDWEAAGFINPTKELLEVAIYWSDQHDGYYNKESFESILNGYFQNGGKLNQSWNDALSGIYKGKLEWLEYNLKLSLGDEVNQEFDRTEGTNEALNTIESLINYSMNVKIFSNWLEKFI